MKEQPILDTTEASKVKGGMWCEYDNLYIKAHCSGVLKNACGILYVDEDPIIFADGSVSSSVSNLRVYEHKPQPEYPTSEGFYRFEGTVYRLLAHEKWQPVYEVNTEELYSSNADLQTDCSMRGMYPDVTPIPYKLVPVEES